MPFNLNSKFSARSERVWDVDFHPIGPWLLTGLPNGTVKIYDIESGTVIRTLQITKFVNVAILCVKFVPRKNWFIAGANDGRLYVFDYNTHRLVVDFQAHSNFLSCLTVHPTAPIVLTGSNDKTIKAWDWDKQWHNIQTYRSSGFHINNIVFNPKDPNAFLSSCSDGTVKMWSVTSPTANFSIQAHDSGGVNYVEFYPGADRACFVTASNDKTIKIWDYLSKSCLQVIKGHSDPVNFAVFHPKLPLIISGSKDRMVKIWNSVTYKVEHTHNYSHGPALSVALREGTGELAVGFDKGVITLKLGYHGAITSEFGYHEPRFSMDPFGKLIYVRNHEVLFADLQNYDATTTAPLFDGAEISFQSYYLGSIKIFASALLQSPNGRFVTVIGGGECTIYTSLVWQKEYFGTGISFAWAPDSSTFAVLKSVNELQFYKNFAERGSGRLMGMKSIKGTGTRGLGFVGMEGAEKLVLHTGPMLGAHGPGNVIFWDWETKKIVRKFDLDAKNIYWSTTGTQVVITTSNTFYVFYFNHDAYQKRGPILGDEGVPESFTLLSTLPIFIQTAKWIEDCLVYTTSTQLCYLICSTNHPHPQELQPYVISSLTNNKLYLLGYIPKHEKLYIADKDMKVYGFGFSFGVAKSQMAALREDVSGGKELLEDVKKEQINDNNNASFSESQDLNQLARTVTTNPEPQFETIPVPKELAIAYDNTTISLSSRPTTASQFHSDKTDETTNPSTEILNTDTRREAEYVRPWNINDERRDRVVPRRKGDLYKQCTTFITEVMTAKSTDELISELKQDEAQNMADFLSEMVNDENITQRQRKRILYLLSKLAKSAQVFPQSLELDGVKCSLVNPVTWGGYGVIYKGQYGGNPVCVKAVHIDSRGIQKVKLRAHASELILWAYLLHPNVLPFLGIYLSKEEIPRVCIVSPWMDNGDLLQYLQIVPDAPRKPLVRDIISGLQYLHDFDVIHADLKAKNVLVSETGRAMLTDFGISRLSMTQTTTSTNAFGSLYWMAPELLIDGKRPNRESDIWAFACTCYEIITGTTPFNQHLSFPLLMRAFREGDIIPLKTESEAGWDENVWLVAIRCWQSDPASRPGTHELLDMIDRLSDPKIQRRTCAQIDYDRILSILDGIRKSAIVLKEDE